MYQRRTMTVLLVLILLYDHNPYLSSADSSTQGTQVGGRLRKNTVWSKENSPYLLVDDITIPPDISLTISEGVTVDLSLWSIKVEGELRAVGTPDEKVRINITLAPFKESKKGRIYFTSTSLPYWDTYHGCKLQHVVICCSDYAITYGVVQGGKPLIEHVEIFGGLSHYKDYAVKTNGTVTNCLFDGVYMAVLMGDGTITKNTFLNTRHGTVIDINNGLVKDNVINGGKRAIRVQNATIASNTIMNMELVGINIQSDETPNPYGKLKPRIAGNVIVKCGEAIKIWGDVRPVVTNNLILENSRGLCFEANAFYGGAKPRIENNAFYSNNYNVYMYREDPRLEVLVDNNWWGTDDTRVIEDKINDEEDNPRLCKVLYEPFLTQPPQFLPKVSYQLSASTPKQVVEITETVVVSGSVVPPLEIVDLIITCVGPGGKRMEEVVSTLKDGGFSYEFKPSSIGTWTINVSPQENALVENSVTNLEIYVTKMKSEVDVGVTPQICFEGTEVTIYGVLNPALQNEVIEFNILYLDGSVLNGYSTTDSQGAFTHVSNGFASGNYQATVHWQGTQDYQGSTETLSYRVYKPSQLTVLMEDEEGYPIEDANIQSTAQPIGQSILTGTSDSSGTVVFSNVIYGSYSFNVEKTSYETANFTAQLSEGEASFLECVLIEEGAIPSTSSPGDGGDSSYSSDPWYLGFIPSLLTFVILITLYVILHKMRAR